MLYLNDKYDVRDYLDKRLGIEISNEIMEVWNKEEKKKDEELELCKSYYEDYEMIEEANGNYVSCLDALEGHLNDIKTLLSVSRTNKTFRDKLNRILSLIREEIDDLEG